MHMFQRCLHTVPLTTCVALRRLIPFLLTELEAIFHPQLPLSRALDVLLSTNQLLFPKSSRYPNHAPSSYFLFRCFGSVAKPFPRWNQPSSLLFPCLHKILEHLPDCVFLKPPLFHHEFHHLLLFQQVFFFFLLLLLLLMPFLLVSHLFQSLQTIDKVLAVPVICAVLRS